MEVRKKNLDLTAEVQDLMNENRGLREDLYEMNSAIKRTEKGFNELVRNLVKLTEDYSNVIKNFTNVRVVVEE